MTEEKYGARSGRRAVLERVPYWHRHPRTQVVLAAATTRHGMLFLNNHFCVTLRRDEPTFEGIKHFHVAVEREVWKFDTLYDLHRTLSTLVVSFFKIKQKVGRLTPRMQDARLTVSSANGDTPQKERDSNVQPAGIPRDPL